jgi:hypothetical protein
MFIVFIFPKGVGGRVGRHRGRRCERSTRGAGENERKEGKKPMDEADRMRMCVCDVDVYYDVMKICYVMRRALSLIDIHALGIAG